MQRSAGNRKPDARDRTYAFCLRLYYILLQSQAPAFTHVTFYMSECGGLTVFSMCGIIELRIMDQISIPYQATARRFKLAHLQDQTCQNTVLGAQAGGKSPSILADGLLSDRHSSVSIGISLTISPVIRTLLEGRMNTVMACSPRDLEEREGQGEGGVARPANATTLRKGS